MRAAPDPLRLPRLPTSRKGTSGGPRSARLADLIREWVVRHGIPSGARLPALRDAADHAGVDKATVAKAYRLLVERGFLTRSGSGPRGTIFVVGRPGRPRLERTVLIISERQPLPPGSGSLHGFTEHTLVALMSRVQTANWSHLLTHPRNVGIHLAHSLPSAAVVFAAGRMARRILGMLRELGVPAVVYGDLLHAPGCDQVCAGHAAGVQLLVEALARQGRRRIRLQMLDGEEPWLGERLDGYITAMETHGLKPLEPLRIGLGEAGRLTVLRRCEVYGGALSDLMTGPAQPDAILAITDGDALAIGAAIRKFHRRVHDDVAVCGFDDYWRHTVEYRRGFPPPCFTIDKDNGRIGTALADMAMARAAGSLPDGPQRTVIPVILRQPRDGGDAGS